MDINDSQRVEQITNEVYVKNPKKVAAGKKNAKSRKKQNSDQVDMSTIYNGIQSAASLVGAGFVLYHGWNFFASPAAPTPTALPTPTASPASSASPASPASPTPTPKVSKLTRPETSIDF